VFVQPPAEAAGDETFERLRVLRRVDAHPQVRRDAAHRLDWTEVAQRVHGHERVVVELALIEDAALAGPAEEVLGAEDLPPQFVDRPDLGEETVATDVEAPAVALHRAADAADDVVGLEDRDVARVPRLHQLICRGEAGRTGADDHDREIAF